MAAKIFRINYKSDFILTMNSEAGWVIPFCIKFWTSIPSRAYYVGYDGETYTHCAYDPSEPTKLVVQFDDHHLPIGDLKFQIAYHFTVADFPNNIEDEVFNETALTMEIDGETYQVMLDFNGETAPGIDFSLPSVGVTSVNGKIGVVTLSAEDVGAQPTIEDLATIRSGAAAGATAVQPDEMTAALATKQNVIEDLATIRSGAAAGATAVQPAALQEGLAGKQDTISDLSTIRSGAAAGATAVQPAALTPIESALQTIEAVIPSAASSQNQLADKKFVNSSIATNTANFVGTYNSLAELQAVQNPTNNDYGFVIETDAQGNEYYDRYKYVAASQQWLFEYKIESTPFTADQWAAIQSGITSALVTKLNALPTAQQLSNQLAAKQDTISDLATIRSGAAAGATAYQKPGTGIPSTDLASAVQTSLERADEAAVRPYNTQSPDGMGYLVLDKDATFASQVTTANTIYEIRYDYDLNGQTVTIPANCVLKFNGGKLVNGTLVGVSTALDGDYHFDGVTFSGNFTNENIDVTSNGFGTTPDISSIIVAFPNAKVSLGMNITTPLSVTDITHVDIDGNGHSIALGMLSVVSNSIDCTLRLQNAFFDCSNAEYTGTGDKGLIRFSGVLNGDSSFYVRNCHFTGYKNATMLYVRRSSSSIIEDCYIEGDTDFTNRGAAMLIYECSGICTIQRNTIKNACGTAISFITEATMGLSANILNNLITDSYSGGIVISGGILYNSNISGNKLINTNTSQSTGATNSAINCHGFQNLNLFNNYIESPNSPASYLDIDGADGSGGRTRGVGLAIKGNYCKGSGFAIVNVDGGVISDNTFVSTHTTDGNTLTGNLVFERNSLKDYSTSNGVISYNSTTSSDMTIRNNYIESSSSGGVWFMAYSAAAVGNISIYCNTIRKYTDNVNVGWRPMVILPRNLVIDDHGTHTKETYQFNTQNGLKVLLPFSNNKQVYQVRINSGENSYVTLTKETTFKFIRVRDATANETNITTVSAGQISPTSAAPVAIKYNINNIASTNSIRYFLVCEPTEDNVNLIVEVYYKAEDNILYT
jgi:hypothetical protein